MSRFLTGREGGMDTVGEIQGDLDCDDCLSPDQCREKRYWLLWYQKVQHKLTIIFENDNNKKVLNMVVIDCAVEPMYIYHDVPVGSVGCLVGWLV